MIKQEEKINGFRSRSYKKVAIGVGADWISSNYSNFFKSF